MIIKSCTLNTTICVNFDILEILISNKKNLFKAVELSSQTQFDAFVAYFS